ncbi:hypothetical protein EV360DRAFT_89302 [Lentinula raphanica]|nr:hypothetical protein EV360DRAFT_89302 [Lentinula raphanica]
MKPYLKNGRPVYGFVKRQSAQDVDSPIFACWCDLCARESEQVVVLETGEAFKGRYFYNIYDAKQHQSLLKDLARTRSVNASTSSALHSASANPSLTPDTIFEPPPPVTPSVAFPIPSPSKTPDPAPNEEVKTDRPSSPSTSQRPHASLAYEYQRLEEISSHLADLEVHPLRYWNPADIHFNQESSPNPSMGEDLFSLFTDYPSNTLVKGHLEWLNQSAILLRRLASLKSSSSAFSCKHTVVKRALDKEMENTRRKLHEELTRREKMQLLNQRYIHLSSHHGETVQPEQQIFLVILMVVAVLHLLYDLSMIPTAFLLGSMRLICATMGHDPKQIQLHLPQDVRVVLDRLDLSPSYTTWVCCHP